MRDRSDEQLMKSYASGSIEAFEVLYERYRGPLYRYILRLVAESATANDLYQGCWEKIVKSRNRYQASTPFRAWLYRIAHNHVMDHFRRKKPHSDTQPEQLTDTQAMPDEQLAQQVRRQDLLSAIQTLPPEQKDTLMLKLESGLSLQAIAEVTGVNPETAKSRLRYAVGRLKRTLADPGLQEG